MNYLIYLTIQNAIPAISCTHTCLQIHYIYPRSLQIQIRFLVRVSSAPKYSKKSLTTIDFLTFDLIPCAHWDLQPHQTWKPNGTLENPQSQINSDITSKHHGKFQNLSTFTCVKIHWIMHSNILSFSYSTTSNKNNKITLQNSIKTLKHSKPLFPSAKRINYKQIQAWRNIHTHG